MVASTKTVILPFPYSDPDVDVLDRAIEALQAGNLIIVPTDTIYGIAGSSMFSETEDKIFRLKNRPKDKPIPLLISNTKQLEDFGIKCNDNMEAILKKFWPGALTVVLKCNNGKEEGFRMPAYPSLLALIDRSGCPLRTTSANLSGEKVITSAQEALTIFSDKVEIILDGGSTGGEALPSTVIKFSEEGITLIREGAISFKDICSLVKN